jgi:acyl-CoA thioester hydrolase
MKPPVWRQDRALYPFDVEIQPRYSDEDQLHHVNNIAVATYYDECRARLMRHIFKGIGEGGPVRIVTAESRIAYAGELFYPDPVNIGSGILRIGKTSFEIGQAAFQNGRWVGVCDTTLVQTSEAPGAPMNPRLRAMLETLLIHER